MRQFNNIVHKLLVNNFLRINYFQKKKIEINYFILKFSSKNTEQVVRNLKSNFPIATAIQAKKLKTKYFYFK